MKKFLIILLLPLTFLFASAAEAQTAEQYFEQGMELYHKQQLKSAIESFSKAIQLEPKYSQAYMWRGIAYDDLGQTDSSIKNYTKSIEIEPSAVAYNNRGIALAIRGKYKEAIKDYNQALELKPDYGVAVMNRGFAYYELGEKEKGCQDWAVAKTMGISSAQDIIQEYCK